MSASASPATATKAPLALAGRNPDVLTCIANLSNDEVFTPPPLANQMLDSLEKAWTEKHGDSLWSDPTVTFLDPCTKSGVFLREITKRLVDGLAVEIPDLEGRVDHILAKQVYGVGITELTSLVARRTVYCSKWANGPHSIVKSFTTKEGNIWFEPMEHTWAGTTEFVETADVDGNPIRKGTNGKCKYCGANQRDYDRGAELETHAYALLHLDDPGSLASKTFGGDMQFDVLIGNPPYQLGQSGGDSVGSFAMPIYQKFVEAAKSLDPRFIVMVTPSRWFTGGRGLDAFRSSMLAGHGIRALVDYPNAGEVFPGVNINGGASYFLWDRDHRGDCEVTTVEGGVRSDPVVRALDEFDVFVRRNRAVSILRKVRSRGEPTFDRNVSTAQPFGMRTRFHGAEARSKTKPIKFYGSGGRVTWVSKSDLRLNTECVDEWKVLVASATDGNEIYPLPIWDQAGPFVSSPGEACSETYLIASVAASEQEARSVVTYMGTRFFRFLVSLRKVAQHNKRENFSFVPDLPRDRAWTDEALYDRYGITEEEIRFIESMIRGMEFTNA